MLLVPHRDNGGIVARTILLRHEALLAHAWANIQLHSLTAMLTTILLRSSARGLVLYPWSTVGSWVPHRDDDGIAATTTYDGV